MTLGRNAVVAAVAAHHELKIEDAVSVVQKIEEDAATKERQRIFQAVLDSIESEMQQVKQWSTCRDPMNIGFLANAHEHAARADALLGFLEVQFCGSYGGFYPGQTASERDSFSERRIFVRSLVRRMA